MRTIAKLICEELIGEISGNKHILYAEHTVGDTYIDGANKEYDRRVIKRFENNVVGSGSSAPVTGGAIVNKSFNPPSGEK